MLALLGDPDAADVPYEGSGHTEAESAGSGTETGGGTAASGRAGDPSLQEGAPHRRAEEVPGRCKMPSKVSVRLLGSFFKTLSYMMQRQFNSVLFMCGNAYIHIV